MAGRPVTTREEADCWLWAVLRDPEVTHGQNSICALLRSRINFTTLLLNPSIDHLASGTAQHTRSVEVALDKLNTVHQYLDWEGGRGRSSRRYRLLINPAVQRELEAYNSRRQAGIDEKQFPPASRGIPAVESNNSRPAAGRTLEPILTLSAQAEKLRSLIGDVEFRAWGFQDADFHDGPPGKIVMPKEYQASHVRTKFSRALDLVWPSGWEIDWRESTSRSRRTA